MNKLTNYLGLLELFKGLTPKTNNTGYLLVYGTKVDPVSIKLDKGYTCLVLEHHYILKDYKNIHKLSLGRYGPYYRYMEEYDSTTLLTRAQICADIPSDVRWMLHRHIYEKIEFEKQVARRLKRLLKMVR